MPREVRQDPLSTERRSQPAYVWPPSHVVAMPWNDEMTQRLQEIPTRCIDLRQATHGKCLHYRDRMWTGH